MTEPTEEKRRRRLRERVVVGIFRFKLQGRTGYRPRRVAILPAYLRRTRSIEELLPSLYLKGSRRAISLKL
jgi:hypothetical protein